MEKNHQETPQVPQVDATRRRLTQAGLAVPAVLGTLASKQVLGATYYCTVSGQVSGNTSTHGPDTGCSITGAKTPTGWSTAMTNTQKALVFNTVVSGNYLYFYKGCPNPNQNTNYLLSTGSNSSPNQEAKFSEILGTIAISPCGNQPTTSQIDLAKALIATILNIRTLGTSYPITEATAKAMFIAVYAGGSYFDLDWQNQSARWNLADVLCYFRLLYGEVSGCSGLSS